MKKIFTYFSRFLPKETKQKTFLTCIIFNAIIFTTLGLLASTVVNEFSGLVLIGLILISFGLGFYNSSILQKVDNEAFVVLFLIGIVSMTCLYLPMLFQEAPFALNLIPTPFFGLIPHLSRFFVREYEGIPEYSPVATIPDYGVNGLPLFAASNKFVEFELLDKQTRILANIGLSIDREAVFDCNVDTVFASFVKYQNYNTNTAGQVEISPADSSTSYYFSYYTKNIFGFRRWLNPTNSFHENRLSFKKSKRRGGEIIQKIKIFAVRQTKK